MSELMHLIAVNHKDAAIGADPQPLPGVFKKMVDPCRGTFVINKLLLLFIELAESLSVCTYPYQAVIIIRQNHFYIFTVTGIVRCFICNRIKCYDASSPGCQP